MKKVQCQWTLYFFHRRRMLGVVQVFSQFVLECLFGVALIGIIYKRQQNKSSNYRKHSDSHTPSRRRRRSGRLYYHTTTFHGIAHVEEERAVEKVSEQLQCPLRLIRRHLVPCMMNGGERQSPCECSQESCLLRTISGIVILPRIK